VRDSLQILPVGGMPEFRPGDDLAQAVASAAPWLADADVVVVTSKVVSKVEGRLIAVPTDAAGREHARQRAVTAQARRVVARYGRTTITETRHGFVLAASGVDASNVRGDELALLPLDPDRSASMLRERLRVLLGVTVAVVVSDTMGRPWRAGLTDVAIGVAGMAPLRDLRGGLDQHGNELVVTEMADADQVAGAAELVKGKLDGVPVAVVRGLSVLPSAQDGPGAAALVRPADMDMFRLGTRDVVGARHTVRDYADRPVDPAVVRRAVAAASTAPDPRSQTPWRFVHVATVAVRRELWAAVRETGGFTQDAPPELLVPCLVGAGPRDGAQRMTGVLMMGAAIGNLLVQCAAEGLGACWVTPDLLNAEDLTRVLDLPAGWEPMGVVSFGHPAGPMPDPALPDPAALLIVR